MGIRATSTRTECTAAIKELGIDVPSPSVNSVIRSVKRKIKDDELCISKADKGNSTVVMQRSDYDRKMEVLLSSSQAIGLRKFNFDNYCQRVRSGIRDSKYVIHSKSQRRIMVMNPTLPRLYGLPKTHKENNPLRPVVSYISAPTYHLCKYLDSYFKSITSFRPEHSVINSYDLIEKIQDFNFPSDSILVSFDVLSLYTCVPVRPTIQRVQELLNQSSLSPPLKLKRSLSLFCLCA